MAQGNLRRKWVGQASIDFADDDELLALAAKAGCKDVFIGFESPTQEGLQELGKKFNMLKGRDFRASVRRIQRHTITGLLYIGLDVDEPGIGKRIAEVASVYSVDIVNTLFLKPPLRTSLWDQMKSENRIALEKFPEDSKYYTLTFPVACFEQWSLDGMIEDMPSRDRQFDSMSRILLRAMNSLWHGSMPLMSLVGNLSCRNIIRLNRKALSAFKCQQNRQSP